MLESWKEKVNLGKAEFRPFSLSDGAAVIGAAAHSRPCIKVHTAATDSSNLPTFHLIQGGC